MRWLLLVLALLAAPLRAEEVPDPGSVLEQMRGIYDSQGDEATYAFLNGAVRAAKRAGAASPEWGIVYAVLADMVRNADKANPAYALQIADEGLALIAPMPDVADVRAVLDTSRAYALADLGRFDEAVASAQSALPMLRRLFTDSTADDLESYVALWSRGQLSAFNTAADEMSGRLLADADAALDSGAYGRAQALAAQAALPADTGLAPERVVRTNARAARIGGQALAMLGRAAEAHRLLADGARLLAGAGWQHDPAHPAFALPLEGEDRKLALELFFWLGRAALDDGDSATAEAALTVAAGLAGTSEWRTSILYARSQVALVADDVEALTRILEQAAAAGVAAGQEDYAALARFYLQTGRAALGQGDAAALLAAAEAALAVATPDSVIDADFVRGEAASFLAGTAENAVALDWARSALAAARAGLAEAGDTEAGLEARRRKMRSLVEAFLTAAMQADVEAAPATALDCPDEAGRGCAVFRAAAPP